MDMINQAVIERGRRVNLDKLDPRNPQYDPDKAIQAGPTAKEADQLVKLANAIRKMENDIGISSLIDAGMRFGEFPDELTDFILNWEAEAYRSKQVK